MALTNKLSNIATAIREKTGSTELMTLDEMPTAIAGISGGGSGGGSGECTKHHIPDEALVISGNCQYRLNYGWEWYIEECGDKITTKDITNAENMFCNSNIKDIPFDINISADCYYVTNMFDGCKYLSKIPNINIPDNPKWTQVSYGGITTVFRDCQSIREVPSVFVSSLYTTQGIDSSQLFYSCSSLNEVTCLPVGNEANITYNRLSIVFGGNFRLKDVAFITNDGIPYVRNWTKQTLDLSINNIGYGASYYNHKNLGFTLSTEVTDDASYQALKDNPDWWTSKVAYSRYNHDSAVRTITTLPDTSAYLASAGGTNTIKFKGAAGSKTDGGAINTLTPEEISIAAAKGWTVSLV